MDPRRGRRDGEREEFALITVWGSIDAVRRLAGDDPERAVFYPDDAYLVDREWTVRHYDVYGSHGPPVPETAPADQWPPDEFHRASTSA